MRDLLFSAFLLFVAHATASSSDLAILPFGEPLLEEPYIIDNSTVAPDVQFELVKRQNNACASGYANCATLGAGGLCCPATQICARDSANNIACCPPQASCTGTIRPNTSGGVFTASATTTTTSGASTTLTGGSAATIGATTTTTDGGIVFVGASGTVGSNGGQSSDATRSYVNNPYYPYAFIPTTYANAAACSSAYTTCHADFTSCSAYLAGNPGANGVTVSVSGGGGTTVAAAAAPTTYASDFASSVCASLSSSACYGLIVGACTSFDGAVATGNAASKATGYPQVRYAAMMGAGVVVAIAG